MANPTIITINPFYNKSHFSKIKTFSTYRSLVQRKCRKQKNIKVGILVYFIWNEIVGKENSWRGTKLQRYAHQKHHQVWQK